MMSSRRIRLKYALKIWTYQAVLRSRQHTRCGCSINTAPENFTLANVVQNIAENTATPNRIRMAAFAVTDDAAGTNTFSLAGPDAQYFEVDDGGLWLKQGVLLDYEQ